MALTTPAAVILAVLLIIILSLLRLAYILPTTRPSSKSTTATLLVVLGSGGHTAEMLRLLDSLDFTKYTHRRYVVSSGDTLSEGKARHFEHYKLNEPIITVPLPLWSWADVRNRHLMWFMSLEQGR
jgi:beta-1,4-N-acetylglucosaminyltransferase